MSDEQRKIKNAFARLGIALASLEASVQTPKALAAMERFRETLEAERRAVEGILDAA